MLRDQPRAGLADSALMIFRNRYVGRGMREDIRSRNYGQEPAFCSLELSVAADFADLFEVKEGRVEKVGELDRPRRRAAPHVGATGAAASRRGAHRRLLRAAAAVADPRRRTR